MLLTTWIIILRYGPEFTLWGTPLHHQNIAYKVAITPQTSLFTFTSYIIQFCIFETFFSTEKTY